MHNSILKIYTSIHIIQACLRDIKLQITRHTKVTGMKTLGKIFTILAFLSISTNAADIAALGNHQKNNIKKLLDTGAKKGVYEETINMYVSPLSLRLLTEWGLFNVQRIGNKSYLVPNKEYFSDELIKNSGSLIAEEIHKVIFSKLLKNMSDKCAEYLIMEDDVFLNSNKVEDSLRPDVMMHNFKTLQNPYNQKDIMEAILTIDHIKKALSIKKLENLNELDDLIDLANILANTSFANTTIENIEKLLEDDWIEVIIKQGQNVTRNIKTAILKKKAETFIEYLSKYQNDSDSRFVDPNFFIKANSGEKITKLAKALRTKLLVDDKVFLGKALDNIENFYTTVLNGKFIENRKSIANIEKHIISLFEQGEDNTHNKKTIDDYIKSLKDQISKSGDFKDQILIVMYYFDRMLEKIKQTNKTKDGLPDDEVFNNLCAFIGRFSHCKTGQAASLSEMITAILQQTTKIAKDQWHDLDVDGDADANINPLNYAENLVNDGLQQVKEELFKEIFVQETHAENSSVLARRNLELCYFLGIPLGKAPDMDNKIWYDPTGSSAWDKVHPVLQALSFYFLKLNPDDFSKLFSEHMKDWLYGDLQAELKSAIKNGEKEEKKEKDKQQSKILEKASMAKKRLSRFGKDGVNSLDIDERYLQTKYPDLPKLITTVNAMISLQFENFSPLQSDLQEPIQKVMAEFYKPILIYNSDMNRTEGFAEGAGYYLLTHMGCIRDKNLENEIKVREGKFTAEARELMKGIENYQKFIKDSDTQYNSLEKEITKEFNEFKQKYKGTPRVAIAVEFLGELQGRLNKSKNDDEKTRLSQKIMAVGMRGLGVGGIMQRSVTPEEEKMMRQSFYAVVDKSTKKDKQSLDRLEELAAFHATNCRDGRKFTFGDDVKDYEKNHIQNIFNVITGAMNRPRDGSTWQFLEADAN